MGKMEDISLKIFEGFEQAAEFYLCRLFSCNVYGDT